MCARSRSLVWSLGWEWRCCCSGSFHGARRPRRSATSRPFDFNIDWVAGHRLVDGDRLYDAAASRGEAVRLLGPSIRDTFRDPFTSFVGLPVVTLVHAPFSLLRHDDALALFRLLSAVAMVGALALVARTLAPGSRLAGLAIGLGALLLCEPALWTLGIGQANGLVMLGFAGRDLGIAARTMAAGRRGDRRRRRAQAQSRARAPLPRAAGKVARRRGMGRERCWRSPRCPR